MYSFENMLSWSLLSIRFNKQFFKINCLYAPKTSSTNIPPTFSFKLAFIFSKTSDSQS